MNEAFYAKMNGLAAKQLANFGKPATLTRKTKTPDPRTGKVTTTSQEIDCLVVFKNDRTRTVDGFFVSQSVALLNVEPKIGDEISGGIKSETVTEVEVTAPVGDAIIWKAVLA